MVLPSIEYLKACGIEGLTPVSRLSAWDAAATDSVCSALALNINILSSKLPMYFINSLTLG